MPYFAPLMIKKMQKQTPQISAYFAYFALTLPTLHLLCLLCILHTPLALFAVCTYMCITLVVSNLHHQFNTNRILELKKKKNLDGKYKFPVFEMISFDKSDLESYSITYYLKWH